MVLHLRVFYFLPLTIFEKKGKTIFFVTLTATPTMFAALKSHVLG